MSIQPTQPVQPTQVRRPWRAVARTVFQAFVGLAAMAPVIYSAATASDPGKATGAVGVALVISAGVTRVMALPGVNRTLQRVGLGAEPKGAGDPVTITLSAADAKVVHQHLLKLRRDNGGPLGLS